MYVLYTVTSVGEKIYIVDEFSFTYSVYEARHFETFAKAMEYFKSIEVVKEQSLAQPYFIGRCEVMCDGFIGLLGREED